jgi:hypothetical protein
MAVNNSNPRKVLYIIGEARYISEKVFEEDNTIITPTSATASLLDEDNVSLATLTVTKSAGLVETIIPASKINTVGNYKVEWDVTYSKLTTDAVKTIITDIIAQYPDSSYLIKLVTQMRVLINDNPKDPNKRIASDLQLKQYLVSAIRLYFRGTLAITTTNGVEDVSTVVTPESDTENLIVLRGAYLYLSLGIEAIAREQTNMFSVSYDSAYALLMGKIDTLMDRIVDLDPNARLAVTDETDIENWGKAWDRMLDALETWNVDSDV